MADLEARATEWLERHEQAVAWSAVAIAFAVFLLDTARTAPLLHIENWHHLPFYGRSRGLGLWGELTKVFDVCAVDDCLWRNRPVNFLLELIDTKLLMEFNAAVLPWGFRSLSRLALVPATAACVAAGLRAIAPGLPRASAWVWGAAFAASGQVLATAAIVGRPAKLWAAFGTALVFWLWASLARAPVFSRATAAAGAALCAAVLGDEQVVFLLGVFVVLDAWRLCAERRSGGSSSDRPGGAFLGAGLAGLAFWALNFLWVGPWLVRSYSTGALQREWSDPRSFLRADLGLLRDVLSSLGYQLTAVLGNWWDGGWAAKVLSATGVLLALAAVRGTAPGRSPAHRRHVGTVLATAVVVMITMMGARHPPILAEDIRRLSYFQATALVALLVLALWFERRGALASALRRSLVATALIAFAVSSYLATPRTKEIALGGALDPAKPFNEVIWRLVEDPSVEPAVSPGLRPDVLDFARFAQGFLRPEPAAQPR